MAPLITLFHEYTSNNDDCIVTRNKEGEALGIPNLQPYFKIKGLLAQHQLNVFSANYELYGDISTRIMATLSTFTPELEIYSIDEAFLEVTGVSGLARFGMAVKHYLLISNLITSHNNANPATSQHSREGGYPERLQQLTVSSEPFIRACYLAPLSF